MRTHFPQVLGARRLFSENPAYQEALVTLRVLDPDLDSDYEYQVNDPRFNVLGGILRLVNGSINFETAYRHQHQKERKRVNPTPRRVPKVESVCPSHLPGSGGSPADEIQAIGLIDAIRS